MPLTTHCTNCSQPKTADRYYNEPFCLGCATAINEVNQYIAAENIEDLSQRDQIRQEALLRLRRTSMGSRPDPRMPVPRVDTAEWESRISSNPGDHTDPRRGQL